MTTGRGRIGYLDSLRGLAAIGVALFWHYQHFSSITQPDGQPFPTAPGFGFWPFRFGYMYGEYAVDLFFVLSGVVFSYVYWDDIHSGRVSWQRFAGLRFARIYPLHFAMLITAGALAWAFHALAGRFPIYPDNGPGALAANLLMLQAGVLPLGFSFNGAAWSLSIEALLYCLFFLLARQNLQAFGIATMLLLGLCIVLNPAKFWMLGNGPVARGLFGFALGMAIYRIGDRPKQVCHVLIGLAAFIVAVRLFALHGGDKNLRYLAASAMGASFLLIVIRVPLLHYLLEIRPLLILGELSLSIYLVHIPVQMLALLLLQGLRMSIPFAEWWFWLAYAGTVLAAAALVHYLYELPARRYLRSVFPGGRVPVMRGAAQPGR